MFSAKPLLLTPLNIIHFKEEAFKFLQTLEQPILQDFESTVASWHHNVDFVSEIKWSRGDAVLRVYTVDEPYYYVDRGTSIRYAKMPKGYRRHTQPRVLGSFPGDNVRPYVNKKFNLPGIEKREFSVMIRDKYKRIIPKAFMDSVIARTFNIYKGITTYD